MERTPSASLGDSSRLPNVSNGHCRRQAESEVATSRGRGYAANRISKGHDITVFERPRPAPATQDVARPPEANPSGGRCCFYKENLSQKLRPRDEHAFGHLVQPDFTLTE